MIKAVLFDLDGLIFNTEDVFIRATSEFLSPLGYVYEESVRRRMMGQQAHISTRILKDHYSLSLSVDEIRAEIEKIFMTILPQILTVMPGFDELLAFLKDTNLPLAVCTSSSSEYAKKLLAGHGYLEDFQFVLGGEAVVNGKPAPDCYLMVCQRLEVLPEQVMVLEDSENGCRAAVDAGTYAVAVPSAHNDGHNYRGTRLVASTLGDPKIREALRKDK